MSKDEFHKNILELGVEVRDTETALDELDTLYATLDKDGTGTMEQSEMKASLKALAEAASGNVGDTKKYAKEVAAAKKEAIKAQDGLE